MIRACSVLALSLLAAFAAAVDSSPAPATVTTSPGGKTIPGFVSLENSEGIEIIDDPKSATPIKSRFKPGTYTVAYKDSVNTDFLKGMGGERDKDWAKAITSYTQALGTSRYDWERERAYMGIANAAMQAKNYDAGIPATDGYEKDYPKGLLLPDIVALRGRLQLAKGDKDAARKAFQALADHGREWGAEAAVKGTLGLADVLAADGKTKEAGAALQAALAKIDPAAHGEEYAQVGLALAAYQDKDPAQLDTFRAVAFSACGPDDQAKAQVGWAKALAAKGDPASTLGAFDHAAIAATLRGADGPTRGEALRLAASLVKKIAETGADDTAKKKLEIEYKGYLGKLQ